MLVLEKNLQSVAKISWTHKGTDVNFSVEIKAYDIAIFISRDADFAGVVKIRLGAKC